MAEEPTFTRFQELPIEIRDPIWRKTMVPRHVELHASGNFTGFYSKAVNPAGLTVCRESRAIFNPLYPPRFGSVLMPPRVRINFELDTILFLREDALAASLNHLVEDALSASLDHLVELFKSLVTAQELSEIRYLAIDAMMQYNDNPEAWCAMQDTVEHMVDLREVIIVYLVGDPRGADPEGHAETAMTLHCMPPCPTVENLLEIPVASRNREMIDKYTREYPMWQRFFEVMTDARVHSKIGIRAAYLEERTPSPDFLPATPENTI